MIQFSLCLSLYFARSQFKCSTKPFNFYAFRKKWHLILMLRHIEFFLCLKKWVVFTCVNLKLLPTNSNTFCPRTQKTPPRERPLKVQRIQTCRFVHLPKHNGAFTSTEKEKKNVNFTTRNPFFSWTLSEKKRIPTVGWQKKRNHAWIRRETI